MANNMANNMYDPEIPIDATRAYGGMSIVAVKCVVNRQLPTSYTRRHSMSQRQLLISIANPGCKIGGFRGGVGGAL